MADIRALTVREPWASAIVDGDKDTENRSQGFPKWYRGTLLIHAGQALSISGVRDPRIRERYDLDQIRAMHRGAVIGVVHVDDVHPANWCCHPWGEDTYKPANPEARPVGTVTHLELARPVRLQRPIPARGALGLWRPDHDLLLEVAHALADLVTWDPDGATTVAERADVAQLHRLLTEAAS